MSDPAVDSENTHNNEYNVVVNDSVQTDSSQIVDAITLREGTDNIETVNGSNGKSPAKQTAKSS